MAKILDKETGKDEILIAFCIADDVIKALGMQGNKQQEMSKSEVLTVAWIAHRHFAPIIRHLYLSLSPPTPFPKDSIKKLLHAV